LSNGFARRLDVAGGATGEGTAMPEEISQEPGKQESGEPSRARWHDPANYKRLLTLDRAGWPWEWLRRNPHYIAMTSKFPTRARVSKPGTRPHIITASAAEEVRDWGLHFCRGAHPPGHRRPHLLASRLGYIGVGRRGAAGSARR
jgi:hypothetical protein